MAQPDFREWFSFENWLNKPNSLIEGFKSRYNEAKAFRVTKIDDYNVCLEGWKDQYAEQDPPPTELPKGFV